MKNKKPFSSEEFRAIYSKVPRLCVDIVVKTPLGLVLTLRSIPPYKGKWHLPGGTVLYKEKITDAVKRVAREELGVPVAVKKMLGYIEYPGEEKERGFGYTVTLVFLCSGGKKGMQPNIEAVKVGIFKELPKNMIEEQRMFLKSVQPL